MNNIATFLEKYYKKNEPIILACSGWPDSMYIAYQILKSEYAKNLVIAYFNHKTRPETDEEEMFLEKLAKEKWCHFETAYCNFKKLQQLYPSKGFEELAREKRYQFFDALMNIYNSRFVITAHHLDDKIETFFFHLLRWSKLGGLINMKESHGWILRPLLNTEKKEILNYLEKNNLEYKIDPSNNENTYSRNKIRNLLLPQCEQIKPGYKKNIKNLIWYFSELQDYTEWEVLKFLWNNKFFDIMEFNQLPLLLQKETIRHIYYMSNNNSTIWLSESNIAEVIKFINGKNNKTIKEIKNMKLRKDNTKILF